MTESLEQKIIKTYVPGESSLRKLAKELGTNHKFVKKILDRHGLYVKRKKKESLQTNIGLYLI